MEEQTVTQEKKALFTVDACYPEERYTKRLFIRTIRLPMKVCKFIIPVIMAELLALTILDRKGTAVWSGILLLIAFFYVLIVFIMPLKAKKKYRAIHAAGEDRILYTYYEDSVRIKSPTVEALLKYSDAESYMENDKYLMITFPFHRQVTISKENCDEEQLRFFRNIVPPEKQQKQEKKAAALGWILIAICLIYALMLACEIKLALTHQTPAYSSDLPRTTYESFEACLMSGYVKDINIVSQRYLEYTFTGNKEEKRLYTYYDGDLSKLDSLLVYSYGSPYTQTTYESFVACLSHGTIKDVEIISDRFAEYTYTSPDTGVGERLYTIYENDTSTLTALLDFYNVNWNIRTPE